MIPITERTYSFNNIQELYQTAEKIPNAEEGDIYAHQPVRDEWEKIGWRRSLWLDGYGAVGDVSSSNNYYNVIQYGDVLENVGRAIEQYDGAIDVEGYVALSPSGHKMSSMIDFYGDTTIEPVDGDEINLGLKVRTGHSGYHAVKLDVGAERLVCSNGMVAFESDMHFEQTHQNPLKPGLAYQAVEAVIEGTDKVEKRISRAREERFQNYDEALLVLMDVGIDRFFENPVPELRQALEIELEDDAPSLYDTYNAATRALTHYVDEEMPEYVRDDGLERAARLLDYPGYGLPEADYLGKRAIDNRIDERIDSDEDELDPILENEVERLSELREAYSGRGR